MPLKPDQCLLVKVFADNVRRERVRQGISQELLAERAGVHRTYVGMLERGEKNVTIYNIERIAHALGVAPASLLEFSAD
ncbi:helix-turn-helix domain-containing protein [Pseudomonas sp. NY15364]|uniref:helix-turn-helix domain-containing protein n=1 Tax=unclassified Pseudomonas TaxID=196821 RepID=UPI0025A4CB42|nr:helix-turn-helix transcriptional regulator [Pseudomonas sp. SO81]WJN61620.1 Transcriptional regulator, Xre family [Pseudomonas sp. SO81]